MNYKWYKIFNKTEFLALGLASKTYTLSLEDIGEKDILVTRGNVIGILYEDIFLALDIGENPFEFENHAIYIDSASDVYLGIGVES